MIIPRFGRLETPRENGKDEPPAKLNRFEHLGRDPSIDPPTEPPFRPHVDPPTEPALLVRGTPSQQPAGPAAPSYTESEVMPDLDHHSGAQPFIRCCQCEGESNTRSRYCTYCGNDLYSDRQAAFNQETWARRAAEKQDEQEGLARLEAARAADARSRRLPRLGDADPLPEVLQESEHEEPAQSVVASPGLELLDHIADSRLRLVAMIAIVGIPALLIAFSASSSTGQFLGVGMLGALVSLFFPGAIRRASRDDD